MKRLFAGLLDGLSEGAFSVYWWCAIKSSELYAEIIMEEDDG